MINFCVRLIVVLCCVQVKCQLETTDKVCSSYCTCSADKVDCKGRSISTFFTEEEWLNTTTVQPVEIDLSHNSLKSLDVFPSLHVQTLNLSNNEISNIALGCFGDLTELVSLDLSHNQITTSVFVTRLFMAAKPPMGTTMMPAGLMSLKRLDISYNNIYSLAQDIFRFIPSVEELDMSGNPLTEIDQVTLGAMSDLTALKVLKLSSCLLEELPSGLLRRQRSLQTLDLSDNRLAEIPTALSEAPSLTWLSLDRNPVESISGTEEIFSKLTNLQYLSLCRFNKLRKIAAGALGGLTKLDELRICNNPRLDYLDEKALVWTVDGEELWPMVTKLDLSNNNITKISSYTLDRWDLLTAVDVTNNPYNCDCNSQWMVDVLIPILDDKAVEGSHKNVVCKSPAEVRGVTFQQLHSSGKELACVSETVGDMIKADADGIILFGIMIGMFVTFPTVLILTLSWRRGYFTRCRRLYQQPHHSDDEFDDKYTL